MSSRSLKMLRISTRSCAPISAGGVSASSMVALKATLFEEEQRAKLQGKAQPGEKKAA